MTSHSDVHYDFAALDAAVRYLKRIATEESLAHADAVQRGIDAHIALSDRFVEETAELRGSIGRMREIAAS